MRTLKYMLNRYVLRRPLLEGVSDLGIRLVFKTEDCLGRHVYKYGVYEREITKLVLSLPFEDGDVFVDVGAHIGWYSLMVDRVIPRWVTVYSFEPEPFNYDLLVRNIKLNKAKNIHPFRVALGNGEGTANIYLYKDINRGRHSLLPLYNYGVAEVEMTTLDKFIEARGVERVKLIKIDVEGFEYMVLKGAEETLKRTDFLILEVTPEYMIKGGVDYIEFIEFLSDLDFEFYLIKDSSLYRIRPQDIIFRSRGMNLFLHKPSVNLDVNSLLNS
ncbi:MAG: FkbM family methyltransferase [Aquificota bacterium]|nr:FkbM family methyltransferase [Aquificota bacterium]